MDNILLIDFQNAVYRASVGFAPKKPAPDPPVADGWDYQEPKPERKAVDESFILIFNFFRNLRPIIEQFSPDKCFAVLEGHPQFRYDLFADYKANRLIKRAANKEMMDKFQESRDEILRIMQHLPITIARAANYEADDTIAALADNMKDENITVLSGDSDFTQLLQRGYAHCQVYNPIKKIFVEAPSYFYLPWKCLAGDKSDNIPKVLSPKKALAAVNDPALFQKVLDDPDKCAAFNMNRQLIEFHPVPAEEIELKEGVRNYPQLKAEFERMDFQSIINEKSWERYTKTFDCIKY